MNSRTLLRQLRANWRSFLAVHLIFTLLGLAVLTPLFGLLLQGLLATSGTTAVADQDIALLLLSPLGMCGAILLVATGLAISGLELGALQMVACTATRSRQVSALHASRYALGHALPLLRLTLGLTLRVLAYLLPLVAAIGLIAWLLLTDYDINYYLSKRPPQFYYALAGAGLVAIPVIGLLGRRLLHWSLVLPLLLFGGVADSSLFAESERLTQGRIPTVTRALLGWLLVAGVLLLIPAIFLDLTTGWVASREHGHLSSLVLLLGLVAACWSAMNFLIAALNLAGFTLVIQHLYQQFASPPSDSQLEPLLQDPAVANSGRKSPAALIASGLVLALLAMVAGITMLLSTQTDDRVLVIAHRGAAGAAPENTLAAVRQAITDQADWVEIDVQESRDGQVVVVHDSDFMKLSSDPIKVWEGDLARLQQIDVGSWFDPDFANERVPTLLQVLEEVRGKSKLVIELKYYGHDKELERRVVDIVEAAGMSEDVVVMSLKLPGVQKLQALRPDWTAGLLAATAIGDLSTLNVDFLAVNANMANPAFIRRAHKAGKRVFVWTINDALSLSRWMSMGVDGVITDEPALARSVMAQRAELSSAERLLLSAAFLFGKPEVAGNYRDNSP